MAGLLIGELAERTGTTAPAIRYYESVGLLTPPPRSPSGYRCYPERIVEELRFIKKAQALGFSLEEISEILRLSRSGSAPCSLVLSLGRQHLAAVEERIRQLQKFKGQLAAQLAKWDGKRAPTCEGLCEFISTAEAEAVDDASDRLTQAAPSGRPRRVTPR